MFKSILSLAILLLLAGCGVMNNPEKGSEAVPAGAENAADDANTAFTKQQIQTLILTEKNKTVSETYGEYRLFEDQNSAENFLHELNTTAQTLSETDKNIVISWISYANSLNTNYDTQNLLFYPLILPQNCTLREDITSDRTKTIITVIALPQSCQNEKIYHPLIYQIDKTIQQMEIRSSDGNRIVIDNISN